MQERSRITIIFIYTFQLLDQVGKYKGRVTRLTSPGPTIVRFGDDHPHGPRRFPSHFPARCAMLSFGFRNTALASAAMRYHNAVVVSLVVSRRVARRHLRYESH